MNRHPRRRASRCVPTTAAAALLACTAPVLAQYAALTGDVTVTPQPGSFYTTDQLVHPENKYIPNVVWRENGAASTEALKVQAIAARGYLYYKLSTTANGGKATSIRDGTADQVYSKSGITPLDRATVSSTNRKYFDVTDATEREILIVNTSSTSTPRWEPVCTFYVAGGKPDTAATTTWWPNGAPLGQWETGDQLPTDTEKWVTYQRGSTAWTPTPLGSATNPVNRGAMSQNGANFLSTGRTAPLGATYASFSGWNYVDILKFYYGQGSQLMMAKVPASGELPINQKVLASFDLDEGYLRNAMNASATTTNVDFATSSHVRDTTQRQGSTGASQRININVPVATPTSNFTYRHMSGMVMGTEANPTLNDGLIGTTISNIIIENRGSIGFWLKTTSPNLRVRPLLDEGATATEQGLLRNVVADGQWHKYEWFLTDNAEWSSFSGGNNAILSQWTLDSILFSGDGNTSMHLDTLFYDARTTAPVNQWVYDANGSYNFAGNWISATPNGIGQTARFWGLTSARRAVSVDTAITVGTLDFNHASGYDLNGPALVTLDVVSGNAAINAAGGAHTINANLRLNDNTVFTSPSGNTTFNGNLDGATNSLTINSVGNTTISGGQLASLDLAGGNLIQKAGATLNVAGEVSLGNVNQINVNGTVNAARVRGNGYLNVQGTVNVAPNGGDEGTSILRGLTFIGSAGKLNLNDNDIVIDHASPDGAAIEAQLRQWVFNGRQSGATSGIFSTPATDRVLAIADATEWGRTTFNGITLDEHCIVGKYTYYGDANLDGKVDSNDYVAVDVGLGTGDSWVQGDFNFSGTVSSDDYVAIDTNLGKGVTIGDPLAIAELKAEMIALHTEMFGDAYVQKLAIAQEYGYAALVPEPSALGVAAFAAIPLLRRRRRVQPNR